MSTITVETTVQASLQKVWDAWTGSEHIKNWNHASDDWECPHAENNLQVGGKFLFTMAAKDGSASFDFNGVYTDVVPLSHIMYTIEGGRTVSITFTETGEGIHIVETFEAETMNPEDMQRDGWQAILTNFKNYVEKN